MSKSEPPKERPVWHPMRLFVWIDKIDSETARRVIQSVISALIGAAILGTIAFIWTQRDWLIGSSKSFWNLLQYPIQLKAWIFFLISIVFIWLSYLKHTRDTEKLKLELSKLAAQDPKFIAVVKFIIDEHRAKGLKYLIEYGFSRDIEKAVPLILKSKTFDDFLANAGLALDIDDSIQININNAYKGGAMAFGVPSRDNPIAEEHAKFTLERGKMVHMNNAAHRHFDWAYTTFRLQNRL